MHRNGLPFISWGVGQVWRGKDEIMDHTPTKSLAFQKCLLNWALQFVVSGIHEKRLLMKAFISVLSWSVLAIITKYHGLSGLTNRNSFSHHSRGWNWEIRLPAWLGSGDGCLPGLQMGASCCVLTGPLLGAWVDRKIALSLSLSLLGRPSVLSN